MEYKMRKWIFAAILTVGTALALPATAQTTGVVTSREPGRVGVAQTVEIQATITHVDAKTREVTLKGPEGNEVTVVAGPEVKNFAQLKAGQNVTLQYLESLVLELKKGGGAPVARSERAGAVAAKPGETPGAIGGREVTVVGDVVGLEPATQTVTVRGPQRTVKLDVRDPEQFKLIAIGDQIEATYTEAVAVSVTPAK
jgi:hypothetical protein